LPIHSGWLPPRFIDQGPSKITRSSLVERFNHKLRCLQGM
jgi:hypothetical protein